MTHSRSLAPLGLFILALLAAPLAVHAQQPGKVYRIGSLGTFPPASGPNPFGDAFRDGLREHGYVEGQNLTIERRFSDGKADRLPALVADLLRLNVQLIVAISPGPSRAAKDATTTVPIAMHFFREAVEAGGLLSFGPHQSQMWRNAAKYVDKVLKGTKPGDIPVEQPTKYELVINLKTATALGLTIPQSVLMRADEVIQ